MVLASAVSKAPCDKALPLPASLSSAAGRPTMSVPNTTGLAARSRSLRVRPKWASSSSVLALRRALVRGVAGGAKPPLPLKLAAVTPSIADSAWVKCVTPSDADVPPPMPLATASSGLPAGKGTALPLRSS